MPTPLTPRQRFADHVVDALRGFGPVEARAMFGGFGIFRHGLMFGLIADDQLYFKADDQSAPEFAARGLNPFRYTAKGRATELRYFQAPPEVFDDKQQMTEWAAKGYECALRAQRVKDERSARSAARRKTTPRPRPG